jgi:hypothetical protein
MLTRRRMLSQIGIASTATMALRMLNSACKGSSNELADADRGPLT